MENNDFKDATQKSHAIAVEDFISQSLRWGVVVSAIIIATGLVLYLLTGDSGYPAGFFPASIPQVLKDVASFKSFAIIDLGLLLLIATPIFRVAASIIAFIFDRDRPYVLITTYVLAMLILSLLLGKAE
ncbi:MAG: DUF1634 domain-containing protein [Moorella humiferrea]|nr:DUF1634 domain-containing protein [Moorella humiferrea]